VAAILGLVVFGLLTRSSAPEHVTWIATTSQIVTLLFYLLYHYQRPHDPKTNKLTRHGELVYSVLILSAFTALGATVAAQRDAARKAEQSKRSTTEQLTNIQAVISAVQYQQLQSRTQLTLVQSVLANTESQQVQTVSIVTNMQSQAAAAAQTTRHLHRLVSPLPPPLIEFDCEVALTNPKSAELLSSLEAATGWLRQRITPQGNLLGGSPSAPPPQAPIQVGIFKLFTKPALRLDFALADFQHHHDREPGATNLLPTLVHPALALRLYAASNSSPSYTLPDMYASFPDASVAQASYFPEQKVLQCRWKFVAAARDLHTMPTLFSIPDLAGSSFRVDITNSPAACADFIRPRRLKILFGVVAMTVTNFAALPQVYSPHVRMPPQELAALMPDVPQADLAERDDPDYNPDAILACRGAFQGLDQITASDPILVPRVKPPRILSPPPNLQIKVIP
jgi:hypothetical protein